MALRLAMRWTPSDSTAVTTAGRPSGTAATASATPRMSTSKIAESPRTSSTRMIVAIITTAMAHTVSPSTSRPCGRAPPAAAWSRLRSVVQHPGDAPHLGLHAGAETTARPRP